MLWINFFIWFFSGLGVTHLLVASFNISRFLHGRGALHVQMAISNLARYSTLQWFLVKYDSHNEFPESRIFSKDSQSFDWRSHNFASIHYFGNGPRFATFRLNFLLLLHLWLASAIARCDITYRTLFRLLTSKKIMSTSRCLYES